MAERIVAEKEEHKPLVLQVNRNITALEMRIAALEAAQAQAHVPA